MEHRLLIIRVALRLFREYISAKIKQDQLLSYCQSADRGQICGLGIRVGFVSSNYSQGTCKSLYDINVYNWTPSYESSVPLCSMSYDADMTPDLYSVDLLLYDGYGIF